MLAERLKIYLDKAGIHYAWIMASIVFLFTLATSTIANAPQILLLPITQAHGWDISDVSIATGLMYFITAMLCPIVHTNASYWRSKRSFDCYFPRSHRFTLYSLSL